MNEPWTPEEMQVADEAIEKLSRTITRIADLLTPEEHASLNADLAEMARIRRRAEAESAFMIVGGG